MDTVLSILYWFAFWPYELFDFIFGAPSSLFGWLIIVLFQGGWLVILLLAAYGAYSKWTE